MKARLNKLKFHVKVPFPKENEEILENNMNPAALVEKVGSFSESLDEDQKFIFQLLNANKDRVDRLNLLDFYNKYVWWKSKGEYGLKDLTGILCHELFGIELHLMIELNHFLFNNNVYYSHSFLNTLHRVIDQPLQIELESYYYFRVSIYELKLLLFAEKDSVFKNWFNEMIKPIKGEVDFLKDLFLSINNEVVVKDKYDFLFKQKLDEYKSKFNSEFISVFESGEARRILLDLMSGLMKSMALSMEKVTIFELFKLFVIDKIWSSGFLKSYKSERSRAYLLYAYLMEPLNLQTPNDWYELKGYRVFGNENGKIKLDEEFAQHMHNKIRSILTINF